MVDLDSRFGAVWSQTTVPVIYRRVGKGEQLWVRLPYAPLNKAFLRQSGRLNPHWDNVKKHWSTPKSWFNDLVKRCLEKFGKVYIVQPYNEMEKCAPACQNATGHICECSCMGANHGAGSDGSWFEVSEAFAFRWSGRMLACRLMVRT